MPYRNNRNEEERLMPCSKLSSCRLHEAL